MTETAPEPLADVNADLSQRVVIDTRHMAWEPSPSGTVWRKPLYRQEGEFCDEHGRYPEGTWMRSPHMSQHTPFSETGCLIYVRVGGL
jgi:hypothetical protein